VRHAATDVRHAATDVLLDFDDRCTGVASAAKLERYEHFLTGWAAHTHRYGQRTAVVPAVVFVCRDRQRARDCARRADLLLCACRAYAGDYPHSWEYSARTSIVFAAERDVHERCISAWGVPALPLALRSHASTAGADEQVATALPVSIPGIDGRRLGDAAG
jgi:hypothetical protein